jgi:hypothetical protein
LKFALFTIYLDKFKLNLSPGEDIVQKTLQPKLVLLAILAAYTAPQFVMAEEVEKITTEKAEQFFLNVAKFLYFL